LLMKALSYLKFLFHQFLLLIFLPLKCIFPEKLVIKKLSIPIRGLPSHLSGKKIAQLSDIHWDQPNPRTSLPLLCKGCL